MPSAILISQCMQNDFVQPLERYDPLPNSLHVGYYEAKRLIGESIEEGPVSRIMDWAYSSSDDELAIIHIRDWHDSIDPAQDDHLNQFGTHCIKDSTGSEFIFKKNILPDREHYIVNASGLNDFVDTDLINILEKHDGEKIRIGIIGVWTEAKVLFLAYELKTRFINFDIAICSALTASSSRTMHFISLDQMRDILGVKIFSSVGSFCNFLTGKMPDIGHKLHPRIDSAKIILANNFSLSETDKKLILYLFKDCKDVHAKCLDGGFSGNVVLKTKSTDLLGHLQVPAVIKIGDRDLIARERISFEKIQEVMGNNAPAIVNFAEIDNRGAIKYRYASMFDDNVRTFQDLYMDADIETVYSILDTVFVKQLGRLYSAAVLEKLNFLEYYDFSSKYAGSVREKVEQLIKTKAAGEKLEITQGVEISNICNFYEDDLKTLKENITTSHYLSYMHGDLNGRNIIIDGQNNVWLIDFFHTHRGHILRDLIKLENDILYIWTKLQNKEELLEAFKLSDILINIKDIGIPINDSLDFKFEKLNKAYKTITHMRSYYPKLVQWDRDPFQLHAGLMRYSVHTISFDESNELQKIWALYSSSLCMDNIREYLHRSEKLQIHYIDYPEAGNMGITILPGRKDRGRNLVDDIKLLKNHKFKHIISLITEEEYSAYGVPNLKDVYKKSGFQVYNFPIIDQGAPSVNGMNEAVDYVYKYLENGEKVLVHCVGGLGRSGTFAACYLIRHCNLSAEEAMRIVRSSRSQRAIETKEQEDFIYNYNLNSSKNINRR